MAQVDQVRTPALVIHSEDDLRCPVEQAHRYYTALKLRGVETELLVFPGENHELSRSGTPHHRKQRFEHILALVGQVPADVCQSRARGVTRLGPTVSPASDRHS